VPATHPACSKDLTSRGVGLVQPLSLRSLCDELGGELDADLEGEVVDSVAAIEDAGHSSLVPVLSSRAVAAALRCRGVLLVDAALAGALPAGRRWAHAHPRWVLASVLQSQERAAEPSVHPLAVVDAGAKLGDRVRVGAGAVVMGGAMVGDDCVIEPHAVIYDRVRLGDRVVVGAGAVIGRPGFGWATGPAGQVCRVPQLGGVVVEDDVEIGALATVDAGTLGPTRLCRGSKLDAHVHVGHNVEIGPGTMVAAQAGFAGSAKVGAGVLVGGQAGVADHVVIGDGARLAGKAGVIGNVAPGKIVAGYPAVDRMRWLRSIATSLRGRS
jgi:UDP-3-O-[3-hydroxymyristoyl] glucosamine N-acyltransferase